MFDFYHKMYYRSIPIAVLHHMVSVDDYHPMDDSDSWSYCCYPNYHDTLELVLVTNGEIHWHIGEHEYSLHSGDIVVINPFTAHHGVMRLNNGAAEFYSVYIEIENFIPQLDANTADILRQIMSGSECFRSYHPADQCEALASIIKDLHALCNGKQSEADVCRMLAHVWNIIAWLMSHHDSVKRTKSDRRRFNFINKVEDYLHENYAHEINTASISTALGYTTSHFCRLFSSCYGTSFSRYLRSFRIRRATQYFNQHTDMTISQISAAVGFTDYNYFSRVFKQELRMSPTEFLTHRKGSAYEIKNVPKQTVKQMP